MGEVTKAKLTAGEYLALEREGPMRSELRDGRMHPVPPSNRWHSLIEGNLADELRTALRGTPWEIFAIDMRLRADPEFYTYPDLSVSKDPLFEDEREDVLLNPTVLVEVLSPPTADYDRVTKFDSYRALPSVQEILHVDQERVHVVHYRRQDDGTWLLTETRDPDGSIELPVLDVELDLERIYERVKLSP